MFCYKQNRPFVWKRREELQTANRQRTNSSAKAAYIVPSSLAGGHLLVLFEELEGSAAGLTVSVGRNDYKG